MTNNRTPEKEERLLKPPQKIMLSQKFHNALDYVRIIHGEHTRKGTDVPALSHLLGVAALVLEYGGDEELAIAALLHDAVEDCGGLFRLHDIRKQFGDRVGDIVFSCSDSLAEEPGAKEAWWVRKVKYVEHISMPGMNADAALVSCADKLNNMRAMVSDYRQIGESLWSRFNPQAGRGGELWYYRALADAFPRIESANPHWPALIAEFQAEVQIFFALLKSRTNSRSIDAELRRNQSRVEEIKKSLPEQENPSAV